MDEPDAPPVPPRSPKPRRWRKYALAALLGLLALIGIGVVTLNSSIGHRFVASRIAQYAPASGLRIEVGRIEGSLWGEAVLRDVAFSDPEGVFARVPVVELDWRPLKWFSSGLDVRKLALRRGTLLRRPKLRPGDPDAPTFPDFDIRIDRLEIDNLTVAKGMLGEQRRVDLLARGDIREGRALVRADGKLGGGDRLFALLDVEPDRDRFDLKLDYDAPAGGLLAELAGAQEALHLRVGGKGSWRQWDGALLAEQDGRRLAALRLTNRAGRYSALGLVWPGDLLTGIAQRATGESVSLDAEGTFAESIFAGRIGATSSALRLNADGAVDLADNRFDGLRLLATLDDPALLGGDTRLEGANLRATLDGPFRDLSIEHILTARALALGSTRLEGLATRGTARFDGSRWTVPLDLAVVRAFTGNRAIDPRLVQGRASGVLTIEGTRITSPELAIAVPGLAGRLALDGDFRTGGFGLAGPAAARGWPLPDLGEADAQGRVIIRFGGGPLLVKADLTGRMAKVSNATLTSLAGTGIRFAGKVTIGTRQPLLIERGMVWASKLSLGLAGRRLADGRTQILGRGRHADYGPFRVDAALGGAGTRAVLVFADPFPAAGLRDVRVALSPIPQGFRIETAGGSMLGPFSGTLGLFARPGGPTRIEIDRLEVWKTLVRGSLTLADGGVAGRLALAGGGVDGTIDLAPRGDGQGFNAALTASDARFGGENPIAVGSAHLEASGYFRKNHSTIAAIFTGQDISRGNLYFARVAANAKLTDGRGQVTASLAGRRGSRFALQMLGDVAPERMTLVANGEFAGRRIAMPRRALLTREGEAWRLAPTQIDFGGGRAIASGLIGGDASDLRFALADAPLSLADIAVADLGLGGTASGLVELRQARGGLPSGSARLVVKGLTRSGLVLTSRPVDVALAATLSPSVFETRAVLSESGERRGRFQARIAGLTRDGGLGERLRAGRLFAQLRYAGAADTLWRLVALEEFDLTGPVSIAADAGGSIANPVIRGSLASDALRLQSALTGTELSGISARGRFAGSRLELTSFTGRTRNGGQIGGSGSFDLSNLGARPPGVDLRLSARNALVLSRPDMAATVSGPIRIVSDGVNGAIAGRVSLDNARWQLGRATAIEELPDVRTREVNRRVEYAPRTIVRTNWRYLIDAEGNDRVTVRGLGLDSEWRATIRLRGTTRAPAIDGRADLVRGGYEFAGRRFELRRGRIDFDGASPPNPRLDILAEAQVTGLNARIAVSGTSLRPEVNFASTPAMPEEEVLSRLLFGNSVTDISAPEALQLGAALASLRGGGGLDPINKLRSAIGLDRLRIVGADAATGRGAGVAVGKYLGRRFYAEIVTDGRGYSATQLEFRVTNWLSLLASVSTIGRESANLRISKDY